MTAPWIVNDTAGFQTVAGTPTVGNATAEIGPSLQTAGTAGETVISEQQTARTTGGTGCDMEFGSSSSTIGTFLQWKNSAGLAVLRVRVSATSTYVFEYLNASSVWTQVGSSRTYTNSTNQRLRLSFSNMGNASTGALSLKVYNASDILQQTMAATGLNLSVATNIAYMERTNAGTVNVYSSNHYICDQADDTYLYVTINRGTANGADQTQTSGDYTSVDDFNADPDLDYVVLTNAGDKFSSKHASRSYGGRYIRGLAVNARLRKGATGPTQAKAYLTIGGTRYYSSTIALTSAFAGYCFTWENNPATAAPWTTAAAEAAALEWGIEAVT